MTYRFELPPGVMTRAVAQGTAKAEPAGGGNEPTAGFPLSLPIGLDSSCVESPSQGQSDSDAAEFDPTIPEAPALDETCFEACETVKLETTGITRQPTQGKLLYGELWKAATTHKFSVAAKLREAGMRAEADVLEDCHSHLVYAQCDSCRAVQVFRNRCDRFYCPECQPKLAKRRAASVAWWTVEVSQPKHVVLTVQNVEPLTRGHVDELKKWFTRLRHRKFCRNWRGGFYSVEVTNEGRGWHLHLHVLVDSRWIDAGELARQWCSVTNGMGKIVKVKDCRRADYLAEVTKYAVKGSELAAWTPSQIAMFIHAFDGARTFGVFGSLYGKRTEFAEWLKSIRDHKPKCSCGCQSMTFYSEGEWLEHDFKPTIAAPDKPAPPVSHPEFSEFKDLGLSFRSATRAGM